MPVAANGIQKTITINGTDYAYWNLRNKGDKTTACVLDPYINQDAFTSTPGSAATEHTKVSIPPLVVAEDVVSDPIDAWKMTRVINNDPDFSGGTIV